MPENLLYAHQVTVRYDRTVALRNVHLTLPASSLTALVGPNGAGKSTLLQAVMSLTPYSGTISVCGDNGKKARQHIAYVPQRGSVDWDFPITAKKVVEQGLYGELGLFGRMTEEMKTRRDDAMDMTSISDLGDRQIRELSGGQQQRVFLSRALLQKAHVYLMDEPFAGVDAATERAIVDVLEALRDAGHAVLVVHHDLATVQEYFQRVTLLNQEVIASGKTQEVFTSSNLEKTYGGRIAMLNHRMLAAEGDNASALDASADGEQP